MVGDSDREPERIAHAFRLPSVATLLSRAPSAPDQGTGTTDTHRHSSHPTIEHGTQNAGPATSFIRNWHAPSTGAGGSHTGHPYSPPAKRAEMATTGGCRRNIAAEDLGEKSGGQAGICIAQ